MSDDEEWEHPNGYARQLGRRLRAIRRQKGLSLHDVEASSNGVFKASALGAYERGERAISVPRLQRLARFYHVPVDELLPLDVALRNPVPDESRAAVVRPRSRGITIDLGQLRDLLTPESVMLNRYVEMIQVERQDFDGRMLTIRRDDLRAVACIFHSDADHVSRVLDDLGLLYTP